MLGGCMNKIGIKIKDWPFQKGEQVKLTWIGEPFKYDNKWMVNAYFKGSKATRKIMLDWASIHFLSIDKCYTDGNLNNGEALENKEVIEVNLSGARIEYKEKPWIVWGTGFKLETKSKTFNFFKNGLLYTVPIIEVIRAILAPDKFMLNRIVEMDTLENYFTCEIQEDKLHIHLTSEYDKKLLNSEKINHLAWLITNPKVFKMFNDMGQNLWQLGELKFDFSIDRFNITARVEKKENYIRVLEIISLKKKRINAAEINIYHPSLEEAEMANIIKKRKFVSNNSSEDRELDSNTDGSTKSSEEISTFLISHEYERVPRINKVKSGRRIRRNKEDESTQKFILEDDKLRTVADTGGEEIIRGLEFTNISKVEEKGELQEFIEVLKLLQRRHDIKSVDIIVGDLPEGKTGKRFSKLSDGTTRRRYAIGKIIMMDGREFSLIEVEREDRALSMLMLKGNGNICWKWIYSILLLELVNGSGKWSNDIIDEVQQKGIIVNRIKHLSKNSYAKEGYIYCKIEL
jgi:hypothetical protein